MKPDFFKRIGLFVFICLVQALFLNHIHLFDCATPLLYVYFTMLFRRNYARWAMLVWSFLLGLAMDTMNNTPGVASASMTFIAFIQPAIFSLFIQRDSPDDMKPTVRSLGIISYFCYASILIVVYCIVFFSLEAFNFFNWLQWLKCVGGSSVLTLALVFVIESVRSKKLS
ncbi:MAG: rod shape-determining protein MreD [Prevotella sp.]|nr:rod shape-determining protein MreD [Prevotella sp.]